MYMLIHVYFVSWWTSTNLMLQSLELTGHYQLLGKTVLQVKSHGICADFWKVLL